MGSLPALPFAGKIPLRRLLWEHASNPQNPELC
ncbi:hypothetical protein CYB_2463 [Synechococcus sp. JA-2-3B'a(2-13)]|nr:hypothetical protein CYB_2463 [Synechococcus sp. JA-2-3B'a(2-13)]